MLRLHPFQYHRPETAAAAVALLRKHGSNAMPVAGGTDLVPNMKHKLFTPGHLVSLNRIRAMRGIGFVDRSDRRRWLRIGALETLASVSSHASVRQWFPGLASAAGLVAGPQLRNMGTIGGNICLDTRCTYYNQTEFWRRALGYCLKKDGSVCHVTKVGKKCVAAHSADTPPNLIVLDAKIVLAGPSGVRTISAADFFVADGIWNTRRAPDEIVTEVLLPVPENGRLRSAYRKMRQRKSIDFPLLSVAVAGDFEPDGTVAKIEGVVSGLGSRPRVLTGWSELAEGKRLSGDVADDLAERARRQCRPLENMTVDAEWRRAMVRVYVGRALKEIQSDNPESRV